MNQRKLPFPSPVARPTPPGNDRIYLAACARDARLTRICVASIRYFYPEANICLMAGDRLQKGLAEELDRYWNVKLVKLPPGDYGWGFVKIEPLFGPPGTRFLVMDVDTAFTGHVLDRRAESNAEFFVDNEVLSDEDFKRLYFDWEFLKDLDSEVRSARSAFNVGQWFGTAGLVERDEFNRWLDWTLPRVLKYPNCFMGGDQGVMNYVVLKGEAKGKFRIERVELMRWPGSGLDDLSVQAVSSGSAPALVIHWAGMKSTLLRNTVGGDLLTFFEHFYYRNMPNSFLRHKLDNLRHIWIQESHKFMVPWKLRLRRILRRPMAGKIDPTISTETIQA